MIQVVKIGGNVIDGIEALSRFLEKFAAMEDPKMLIHGGGKLATRLSAQLGIETQMIDGRRVTDRETLDVVTMVYAGLVNKQIVARLCALGCNNYLICSRSACVICGYIHRYHIGISHSNSFCPVALFRVISAENNLSPCQVKVFTALKHRFIGH